MKAADKRFAKNISECKALEEYLIKVENLWHPPQTASSQQRNSRTNKQRAKHGLIFAESWLPP